MDPQQTAQDNFTTHIKQNSYPGRGLVVGRDAAGAWLQVYWIMGRSEHSRNRRFVVDGTTMRTEPVDVSLVEDPSLIIYEAMLEADGRYIATNGDQTRTIADALAQGGDFDGALAGREREPDAPNYTPRISALLDLRGQAALALSILKANPLDPTQTDRFTYRPAAPPAGLGLGLTTYAGDGSPLPSFSGEPLLFPLVGTAEQVLESYWDALDADNRISLAVKRIDAGGSLILAQNRYGD
jgi:IMP cyclohydrolase